MISRIAFFLQDFLAFIIAVLLFTAVFIVLSMLILKSNMSIRLKKLALASGFFLLSLILLFCLLEGYFRYIYDESDGLGFLQVNKRWSQRHVIYNSDFKRDRNFNGEKTEGVIRIGALGDSITFGQGVAKVDDRFTNLLEKKLNKGGIKAEVYNLGVPGLDTHEEIEIYKGLSHLNFDILVWQYYLNDIQPEDKSEPARIISQNAYPNRLIQLASQETTFFDFLYWRLSSKYSSTFKQLGNHYLDMYGNKNTLDNHKEELSAFIRELKDQNKTITVIIFPFIELLGPNYPAHGAHQEMKTFFESQDIEVIDLLDDLQNRNWKDLVASKFDTHPNEIVHNIAATKLYEKLRAN